MSDRRTVHAHASGGHGPVAARPDARAEVLALQRAVGNRATMRLLRQPGGGQALADAPAPKDAAPRRGRSGAGRALQRSCLDPVAGLSWNAPDDSEVFRQWSEDWLNAEQVIRWGQAMIAPHIGRAPAVWAPAPEPWRPVGSPPHSPVGWSPWGVPEYPVAHTPPGSPPHQAGWFGFARPIEESYAGSPPPQRGWKRKRTARRRLQRATSAGSIQPGGVAALLLALPGVHVRAWKPFGYKPKAPGYALAQNDPSYPLGPQGTASAAKLVRAVSSQVGSGVGQTRPLHWWNFLALAGPGARMRWVQGHFINRRLGGHGEHQNLAPFTYSMNSVHYHQVEKPVLQSLQYWKGVSYTVRAIPNSPGSVNEIASIAWHRAFLAANRPAAVAAMVAWGLLDPADAPTIIGHPLAAPPDATPTPCTLIAFGLQNWGEVKTAAEDRIRLYVQQAFPGGIVCRARYYDLGKQVGQVIIDNTPT